MKTLLLLMLSLSTLAAPIDQPIELLRSRYLGGGLGLSSECSVEFRELEKGFNQYSYLISVKSQEGMVTLRLTDTAAISQEGDIVNIVNATADGGRLLLSIEKFNGFLDINVQIHSKTDPIPRVLSCNVKNTGKIGFL